MKQRNWMRFGGVGKRLLLSKAKSMSFKLAMDVKKVDVMNEKCADEKNRGRTINRAHAGAKQINL